MQIRWDIKRNAECASDTADVHGVLGLAPAISVRCDQPKFAGTFTRVPGGCLRWSPTLRYWKGEERRKKKGEVLHLFRCYTLTHTHPAGAGSTLKGKRKKKADTDDGQMAKTPQGGKGTNGPPEPTYAAKRTWQKTEHTPKPHNTLRRSMGGKKELGTKWGTSWWQE